jgi:hypothetical protein
MENFDIPYTKLPWATVSTHECRLIRHAYQIYTLVLLCMTQGDLSWSQF